MFKFIVLSTLIIFTASIITTKAMAQENDEEAFTDAPAIVPSPNANQSTPPMVIDESDSGPVSDVDEYDN